MVPVKISWFHNLGLNNYVYRCKYSGSNV